VTTERPTNREWRTAGFRGVDRSLLVAFYLGSTGRSRQSDFPQGNDKSAGNQKVRPKKKKKEYSINKIGARVAAESRP
jgi:hypothetical protein